MNDQKPSGLRFLRKEAISDDLIQHQPEMCRDPFPDVYRYVCTLQKGHLGAHEHWRGMKELPELADLRARLERETHARFEEARAFQKELDHWRWTLEKVISAAKGWWSELDMYRNAWLREIGGTIRNKHHEIDGFVLRTRDIYEGYKLVPKLEKRIRELEAALRVQAEKQ